MSGQDAQTSEFKILSQTRNVCVVGEKLKQICEGMQVPPAIIEDIIIAADEAVTNIMMHGYQGREDGIIDIRCTINKHGIVLRIEDQGKVFWVPSIDSLTRRKQEQALFKGGYGLILMHKFMDVIRFSYDKNRKKNILVMEKAFNS